ncbi:glycosyltransferase family 4 protein [Azoarcus sp. KH32C]|uniref:MraY family glycosyltransferase n=1 Tax=Azoarcus sp. KH32C TaxID=748247 RepID=UPI0002386DF4|nr:glycosyltransferase family 4 protein [Azoarcus sp. KH32C]BAL26041.1 glycosyl transferase, group 4 family protein [Azoarcus sp. KH32C]
MTDFVWLLTLAAIFAGGMTWGLRRYALARSLMDIPNARSSHSVPTPRGGGVAIVLTFLCAVSILTFLGRAEPSGSWAILGAGVLVAVVGFIDDHRHLAARWRLLAHFVAAAWALVLLDGAPRLDWFGTPMDFGWVGATFAAVYLVWLLNLYNFMDGIDGIASVEAICVCVGGALLYFLGGRPDLMFLPLVLAAAVGGFLYWNFPPAKIFMGDAGSGFLGIVLGTLSIQAAWVSPAWLWSWLILLGVFIVDATWTLLRRLCRGERVYEAHRSHAYQHAAQRWGRHLPVTLAVAAINMFWLLPISLCVGAGLLDGVVAIAIAYAPLLAIAIALRAGEAADSIR